MRIFLLAPTKEKERVTFLFCTRGEGGIRTRGTFPYTRSPSVRLQPLGHLSIHGFRSIVLFPKRAMRSVFDIMLYWESMKEGRIFSLRIREFIFLIGVALASIGGIIVLSTSLKLTLFPQPPELMDYEEMCINRLTYPVSVTPITPGEKIVKRKEKEEVDEKEVEECVEKMRKQDVLRYRERKLQTLIDGVSILIVGLILLAVFSKKREQ